MGLLQMVMEKKVVGKVIQTLEVQAAIEGINYGLLDVVVGSKKLHRVMVEQSESTPKQRDYIEMYQSRLPSKYSMKINFEDPYIKNMKYTQAKRYRVLGEGDEELIEELRNSGI